MIPATLFLFEFLDQPPDIGGGALLTQIAVIARQINRGIKRRQINDAQAVGATVPVGRFHQLSLGLLVFQFDFVANQDHDAP